MLNNIIDEILTTIRSYNTKWAKIIHINNPYQLDNLTISDTIPSTDHEAYFKYPDHNFVYDKLQLAQSQHIESGTLGSLLEREPSHILYPLVIKPRWGHKSNRSYHVYKISEYTELKKYRHLKNMIWTTYYEGDEEMTDFILLKGKIVYMMTLDYSKKSREIVADDWKYIAPHTQPPQPIIDWVNTNMRDYTGAVNVQYIDDKIIEVSLRFARGGAYIYGTKTPRLIQKINHLADHEEWSPEPIHFKPFYSFKCFTQIPIILLVPDGYIREICKDNFYEYYFEPNGKKGQCFFQFFHDDFKTGLIIQKKILYTQILAQCLFILFVISAILLYIYTRRRYAFAASLGALILLMGTLYNHVVHNVDMVELLRLKFLDYQSSGNI